MGSSKDIESGRALGDNFGSSVSIASWEENNNGAGGVVLVGAPLNDEAGEDSGRIYSYSICDTSLDQDQAEMLFTVPTSASLRPQHYCIHPTLLEAKFALRMQMDHPDSSQPSTLLSATWMECDLGNNILQDVG
eukprot:scaffold5143_cov131-Skeletonema_menzelii.AAC.1